MPELQVNVMIQVRAYRSMEESENTFSDLLGHWLLFLLFYVVLLEAKHAFKHAFTFSFYFIFLRYRIFSCVKNHFGPFKTQSKQENNLTIQSKVMNTKTNQTMSTSTYLLLPSHKIPTNPFRQETDDNITAKCNT